MPPDGGPALASYETFASAYDAFTADHDYDAWTATLERLAREHGLTGQRLLDVGCGTGKSFMPLLGRGYRVVGCDLSPAMAARAMAKAPHVRVLVCDMRRLPVLGAFDWVTCLDDAMNYLLEEADLAAAFASAARNLCSGGVYVFDLNTLRAYREVFGAHACSERDGYFFAWRGESGAQFGPGELTSAVIEAFQERGDGTWTRLSSVHAQRHHPETRVRELLERAGLDCRAVYGQFRDGSAHAGLDEERHTKAVYVARKP